MGITLVIVGGITLISLIAIVGESITKVRLAATRRDPKTITELERRLECLEQRAAEQDQKISLLEGDIAFANRLLEDASKKGTAS